MVDRIKSREDEFMNKEEIRLGSPSFLFEPRLMSDLERIEFGVALST